MLFKKVVNPNVDLVKRDVVHLFSESDFPRSSQKTMFYEACNCYISIECIDDIEEFTDDKDTINRLKNKNVYFVQFGATVEELGDKKSSLVLEDVYENFIDDMEGSIKYLNDYLMKEGNKMEKRIEIIKKVSRELINLMYDDYLSEKDCQKSNKLINIIIGMDKILSLIESEEVLKRHIDILNIKID